MESNCTLLQFFKNICHSHNKGSCEVFMLSDFLDETKSKIKYRYIWGKQAHTITSNVTCRFKNM